MPNPLWNPVTTGQFFYRLKRRKFLKYTCIRSQIKGEKKKGKKNQVARKQGKNKMLASWAPSNKTIHCADSKYISMLNSTVKILHWQTLFSFYLLYLHSYGRVTKHPYSVNLKSLFYRVSWNIDLRFYPLWYTGSIITFTAIILWYDVTLKSFTLLLLHCLWHSVYSISKSCFIPTLFMQMFLCLFTQLQHVNIYQC